MIDSPFTLMYATVPAPKQTTWNFVFFGRQELAEKDKRIACPTKYPGMALYLKDFKQIVACFESQEHCYIFDVWGEKYASLAKEKKHSTIFLRAERAYESAIGLDDENVSLLEWETITDRNEYLTFFQLKNRMAETENKNLLWLTIPSYAKIWSLPMIYTKNTIVNKLRLLQNT